MGGHKRRMKRMKRQRDESAEVIEALSGLLNVNGFVVNFPHDITRIVAQLLEERKGGAVSGQQAGPSRGQVMGALGGLTSPSASNSAPDLFGPATPQASPSFDPFADLAPVSSPVSAPTPAPTPAPAHRGPAPPPMPMDQMQAMVASREAQMLNRVASHGVQYRGAGNPEVEGVRMQLHPSVKAPSPVVPGRQADPPRASDTSSSVGDLFSSLGGSFGGGSAASSSGSVNGPFGGEEAPHAPGPGPEPFSAPSGSGERANPHTGLTPSQQRDLIARLTGKAPTVPEASPVPKPPGM